LLRPDEEAETSDVLSDEATTPDFWSNRLFFISYNIPF